MLLLLSQARDDGWAIEDTVVTVDAESLAIARSCSGAASAVSVAPSSAPFSKAPSLRGRGGRLKVRIDYVNVRTGSSGGAEVQTLDPDAISEDPAAQAAFLRRITTQQAAQLGVPEKDILVTLDADSIVEARRAAEEKDDGGLNFYERCTIKVKGRYNEDKAMFDHAAAVVVLLRRTSDPNAATEAQQAAADVLGSSLMVSLEKGGWKVRSAVEKIFELQKADPSRQEFPPASVFVNNEDVNTRALVGVLLKSIAAVTSIGAEAEEALLAVTVRSGQRLETSEDALSKPMSEIVLKVRTLAGGGFVDFGGRMASLIASTSGKSQAGAISPPLLAAKWTAMEKELEENEKLGWHLSTAVQLMRFGVRDRESLVKDTDPRSAFLVEHMRRLVLAQEGTPTDDLGGSLKKNAEAEAPLAPSLKHSRTPSSQGRNNSMLVPGGDGSGMARQVSKGEEELSNILEKAGLGAFGSKLADFGCESAEDLCDGDIVSDANLAKDIGMKPAQVIKLRRAAERAKVVTACSALLTAAGPTHEVWKLVKKILFNIKEFPGDTKYRRLKEASPTVGAVWTNPQYAESRGLLELLGFRATAKASATATSVGGRIELPPGDGSDRLVRHALEFLNDNGLGGSDSAAFATSTNSRAAGGGPDSGSGGNRLGSGDGSKSPKGAAAEGGAAERVLPENLSFLRMRPEKAELVGKPIGEGSFGVVFMGTYQLRKTDAAPMQVAFKRIKLSSYGVSPEIGQALMREVQAMQRLNHPNLLRLFCVSDNPAARDRRGREVGICLCLEYCDKGSLKALLDDKTVALPWPLRVKLAYGITRGMAELYGYVPIIQHRDLKSMNILVTADWTAKVSDFGLARHRTESTIQSTLLGKHKGGTFRWAAPETFDSHFTEASDVYSFAVTLWELASRALPYGDKADQAIMMAVYGREERPDLTQVEAGCPPMVIETIKKCWAHDPKDRPTFKVVAESLGALDAALNTATGTAGVAGGGDGMVYDVFLSHKQADAQDFCRHLYDLLTAKGYRVFLDRVDASKLHSLPDIVRSSRCVVFVLSDKIFESSWCLYELKTAVDNGTSVVPLRMEGSTWGGKNFPDIGADYIPETMTADGITFEVRPALRELFKIKAIEHSREYFGAFIDRLVVGLPSLPKS